ncbi:MAG: hypothetical protein Tsb0017_21230 [Geothermobacteraceae bacterium]
MRGFLNDCRQIELIASRIYRELAARDDFPEEDRQAFSRLADDEEDHALMFETLLELPEGRFETLRRLSGDKAWEELTAAQDIYRRMLELRPNLRQALKLALELERRFVKVHADNSLVFDDPRIPRLLCELARADEEHLATLNARVEAWNRRVKN